MISSCCVAVPPRGGALDSITASWRRLTELSLSRTSMMNLCLSFDHRLIDGAYAVQFMAEIRANLQSWNEERY